jgi:predicted DNA-binding antitoxin AbrB/MazE fold protein
MNRTIEAIFENGVFRPAEPVQLPEGSRVSVSIPVEAVEPAKSPGEIAYEFLARIAAMPSEGPKDGFSGADHDKVLYGGKDGVR